MMNVGRCTAKRAARDCGMVHEIVLFIHDRACTANEQQRIAVVQLSNLVRGQQLFTTMSSDEFKMGKKIPLLIMRRGIKCDIQKLDSQLLNNIA